MQGRAWRNAGGVTIAMALLLGLPLGQQTQTAPAKLPLEVTYYFLPG